MTLALVCFGGASLAAVERSGHEIPPGTADTLALGASISLDLVRIPAGSFLMGSPPGDTLQALDESPRHAVTLRGFWMSRYEITQAQWDAVMETQPSFHFACGPRCPVEQVSWDDCRAFCEKLSRRTGRVVRLPSEAEWEYACRAGSPARYSFGDSIAGLSEFAWYCDNSHFQPHPVGLRRPNAWGLYDMLGNLWEWCEDWYHLSYRGAPRDGRAWESAGQIRSRVVRGGGYGSLPSNDIRSADRSGRPPELRNPSIGFRVVVER